MESMIIFTLTFLLKSINTEPYADYTDYSNLNEYTNEQNELQKEHEKNQNEHEEIAKDHEILEKEFKSDLYKNENINVLNESQKEKEIRHNEQEKIAKEHENLEKEHNSDLFNNENLNEQNKRQKQHKKSPSEHEEIAKEHEILEKERYLALHSNENLNKKNKRQNKHEKLAKEHEILEKKHYSDLYNNVLGEHTTVTDSNVFPYMVSVLKGTTYLSSGALVDERWVLTTADGLYLMEEALRFLRVRLGSINYKKGGLLLPVKLLELHPYFDYKMPNYDLALIMLAKPVRYTPNLKAIRILMTPKEVTATHFIVTSWPGPLSSPESKSTKIYQKSMDAIKRHRMLSVTHLHPSDPEECAEQLYDIGATNDAILCLDPAIKNPCGRDVGAPVVLNHVLWAVVSSWKPDDCERSSGGPIFANLVSAANVSSWIHATVHGHRWKQT